MATNTDVTQLNGLFKEVYADNVLSVIPDNAILTKRIPFNESGKIGNHYNQPVKLTRSQGVTYAAADAGAFTLNSPVASTTKNAQVTGAQMLIRDRISYDAAAKASHGGKKSFVSATRYVVDSMMETMTHRLEVAMLYGGTGLAQTASSSNVDTTHTVITFSAASWAVGIWAGAENAQLQFYTNVPALVSSGTDSVFNVDSVSIDGLTATVSGTTTGITALDTAIGSATCAAYFNGSYGNEMSGIDKIITNTGSLFGIDASTYNMWAGSSYGAGSAALTFAKVLGAINKAVGRGLSEGATLFCSPNTWKDLASDLAALRTFDSSYGTQKNVNGQQVLEYYSSNGKIEVISHPCVKQGEAFIVPLSQIKRIGESDVTFKKADGPTDNQFFHTLSDNAGYELRVYTDQGIFCQTPARTVKITGITNS